MTLYMSTGFADIKRWFRREFVCEAPGTLWTFTDLAYNVETNPLSVFGGTFLAKPWHT